MSLLIQEGDTVIITGNDNKSFTIHHNIHPNDIIKLHKGVQISARELIHQPYFAFYRVNSKTPIKSSTTTPTTKDNNDEKVDENDEKMNEQQEQEQEQQQQQPKTQLTLLNEHPDPEPLYCQEESKEDMEKDNRGIVDDNRAQQLTLEQIEELKKKSSSLSNGVDASTIIDTLVSHSSSFAQKNNFSQQKYLKKKKQKYMTIIKVLPPSIHEMCRVYMEKKPEKISHLRFDALAQLLYLGNVYSNTQVMIVESCMGLVTAGALERMCGFGRILKVAENNSHHFHCAKVLNQRHVPSKSVVHDGESMIYHVPFSLIAKLDNQTETAAATTADTPTTTSAESSSSATATADTAAVTTTTTTELDAEIEQKKMEKQRHREEMEQRITMLLKAKSDSLIIAGDGYDPESILVKLWPYLQLSGTFAIFCPYIQPLQQCYNMLRARKNGMNACMITLTETWTREQQVLPLRTHPVMRMHATSGFILAGTKLE